MYIYFSVSSRVFKCHFFTAPSKRSFIDVYAYNIPVQQLRLNKRGAAARELVKDPIALLRVT